MDESQRFGKNLWIVRRERIVDAFHRGSGNSALPVRLLGQLLCRNWLWSDCWYMVMETMMD